ncbi:MAG TPA: Rid family hydrolase [Pyrinomonadaceae bacterium]|jgi:2-aminomuconate deaminase|nr:Rid family hydrolase [Pyrinomonadaceae bacterium]
MLQQRSWSAFVVKFIHTSMDDGLIDSSRAPEPVGLYPHARRVGDLLFLSGVGPRERGSAKIPGVQMNDAGEIVSYDIEEQCRSVFRNVRYILEDAGSSWDDIVDVTVFLTNMKADFAAYNRIYAEYFADNKPCRTTVEVGALPTPIAIEVKIIATTKKENR